MFGEKPYRSRAVDACRLNAWTLALVHRETGEECYAPFRCHSWRCSRCAPAVNARDAQRILAGLGVHDPANLLFLTLTYDPAPILEAVARNDPTLTECERHLRARAVAWRLTRASWKALRDRLAYRLATGRGRQKRRILIPYVQTWEGHRSGWPHVHAILCSPELAADVRRQGSYQGQDAHTGEPRAFWRWKSTVLEALAVRSGFGPVADIQFPRKWEAVGGYLVKLAAELTASAKKGQTPTLAPRGFRRLRATPKLIPRARPNTGDYLGAVLQAPAEMLVRALDAGCETWKAAEAAALNLLERIPFTGAAPPRNDPSPLRG